MWYAKIDMHTEKDNHGKDTFLAIDVIEQSNWEHLLLEM
jgi:hypothetical protein